MEVLLIIGAVSGLASLFTARARRKDEQRNVEDFRAAGNIRESVEAQLAQRALLTSLPQGPQMGWWGPQRPQQQVWQGEGRAAHLSLLPPAPTQHYLADADAWGQRRGSAPQVREPPLHPSEARLLLTDRRR